MKKRVIILNLLLLGSSLSPLFSQRVLVISGGGARGAWGGGVAENLVVNQKNDYDVVIGTSTGSLMAPFVANENFGTLKHMYTNVKSKSIFNVNPFKVKRDTDGEVSEIKPKFLKAIFRIIFGKKTLGESKNLRKLIYSTYSNDVYEDILTNGDEFIVTVTNFSTSDLFYFSSRQEAFDSRKVDCSGMTGKALKRCLAEKNARRTALLDWIWRSGNQPVFMTLDCTEGPIVDADNNTTVDVEQCWVDGGVRENIPLLEGIKYILEKDADLEEDHAIDVIINNLDSIDLKPLSKKRILNSLFRTLGIFTFDVRDNDVNIPSMLEETFKMEMYDRPLADFEDQKYIEVNLYFMPEDVYNIHRWDLHFDPDSMTKLWDAGKELLNVEPVNMKIPKEVAELLINRGMDSNLIVGN